MQQKKITISKCSVLEKFIYAFMVFVFFYPHYLRYLNPTLSGYYASYFPVVSVVIGMVVFFYNRLKAFWAFFIPMLFYIIIGMATVFNHASLPESNVTNQMFIYIGFVALIYYAFNKKNPVPYLYIIHNVLFVLLVVNLILIIANPDGLYLIWGHNNSYSNPAFLFGHKNNAIEYMLPCIVFSVLIEVCQMKRFSIRTIVTTLVSLVSVLLTRSLNSILALLLFVFAYSLSLFFKKIKFYNILSVWGASIALTISVAVLKIQNYFGRLIELVFHKDVTLNSRTLIWDRALEYIPKRILLGYGIENSELTASRIIHISSTHNYYLDFLYYGGLILFVLMLVYIVILNYKNSSNSQEDQMKLTSIFCSYFLLWVASPTHRDYIFLTFGCFISFYLVSEHKQNIVETKCVSK